MSSTQDVNKLRVKIIKAIHLDSGHVCVQPWLDQVSACAVALDPSTRDIQDFWGISGLEEIKMVCHFPLSITHANSCAIVIYNEGPEAPNMLIFTSMSCPLHINQSRRFEKWWPLQIETVS